MTEHSNLNRFEHSPCVPTKDFCVPPPPQVNPKIFLDTIFKGATGYLMLASKKDGHFKPIPIGNTQDAYEYTLKNRDHKEIYYGTGLINKIPKTNKRGTAKDVQCITCTHVDIDINGVGHAGNNYPPSEEEALNILKQFPLPPSIIVNSGGGLHVYWLFDEPLYMYTEKDRESAKELLRRFQANIRIIAQRAGYTIDNTSDICRVYRVVGSYNLKTGTTRQVKWISNTLNVPRYSVAEIEKNLIPEPPKQKNKLTPAQKTKSTHQAKQFEPSNFDLIIKRCAWMQHCRDDAAQLPEPEWFSMLTILSRCVDGEKIAHELSTPYPNYTYDETGNKYGHASSHTPHTCSHIASEHGFQGCASCPFKGHVKSPIQLGEGGLTKQAKLTAYQALSQVKENKDIIYEDEVIQAFVTLKMEDLPEFTKLRGKLKNRGITYNQYDPIIEEAAKKYAYESLEEPPLFYEENNCLYHNKPTGDGHTPVKLSNFSAEITKEITLDDGYEEQKFYYLEGRHEDGKVFDPITWTATEFKKLGFIDSKYGVKAVCYSNQLTNLGIAIKELSNNVVYETAYSHTGFRKIDGKDHYLSAAGAMSEDSINPNTSVRLEQSLVHYNIPMPTRDDKVAGMKASIKIIDVAPDCVGFVGFIGAYRAILSEALPPEYSLFMYGHTGSRKTALARVLQAHYGKEFASSAPLGNWISTANSTEKMVAMAKDALTVMDDYIKETTIAKQAELDEFADRILRGQSNKAGRTRMGTSKELIEAYVPKGLILATGEQIPKGKGSALSLRGRMVITPLTTETINNDVLSKLQSAGRQGLLTASAAAFIQWLAPKIDSFKKELITRRNEYRDKNDHLKTIHHRTPDNYADLMVSLEVILQCFEDYEVITQEEKDNLLARGERALQLAMQRHGEFINPKPTAQYLGDIKVALNSGTMHFVDSVNGGAPSNPELWGWKVDPVTGEMTPQGEKGGYINKDSKEIYLLSGIAIKNYRNASQKLKRKTIMTETQIHKRLSNEGLLLAEDNDSYKTKRETCDDRIRVLVLSTDSLS
ncbi:hypothetical protein [Maridesulfovibrio sp.]|uniref:hypothetical protein n=1 Tax=unclassified Maridesulfovibrio TaxID=2794999 RepID=UPI003AFFE336